MLNIPITYKRSGHWLGIFICKNAILYYDSLFENIKPEFDNLLHLLKLELKIDNPNVLFWKNKKQTQYSGKHCGVFQIHFVCTCIYLYMNNLLFINDKLNTDKLEYYLERDINQKQIENTIGKYFFYDK